MIHVLTHYAIVSFLEQLATYPVLVEYFSNPAKTTKSYLKITFITLTNIPKT